MIEQTMLEWPIDKNVEDFEVIATALAIEGEISRSNAVRYLIQRVKLAENKLRKQEICHD